ncbi:cation:proton antiporter [Candidatus Micrarchaeota archaeon]|nr:cation:proton antiporter [Candidatus Micrarchaeota archaeon]
MLNRVKLIKNFLIAIFVISVIGLVIVSSFGQVKQEQIYFEIGFLLIIAAISEYAVIRYKLPSVLVLMIVGIMLSNSFIAMEWTFIKSLNLPLTIPSQSPALLGVEGLMKIFAQFGAVLFLFKIGLENKKEEIFKKNNFLFAMFGAIIPFIVGYAYAQFTGGSFAYSVFLGAALTGTNLGVNVAVLREKGLMGQEYAKTILGSAVIDDILGLFVLSLVTSLTLGLSLEILLVSLIIIAFFIICGLVFGEYFLAYLDGKELSTRRLLFVLAFALFFAYIADIIKVSAIVGAFFAGTIINRSKHIKKIIEQVTVLEVVFMPVFFISIGMLVDVTALTLYAIPIAVITFLALMSKTVSCYIAGIIQKNTHLESLIIGIGMSPRGAIGLIVASIGYTTGALNLAQFSMISAMAVLTSLAVTPLLSILVDSYHQKIPIAAQTK